MQTRDLLIHPVTMLKNHIGHKLIGFINMLNNQIMLYPLAEIPPTDPLTPHDYVAHLIHSQQEISNKNLCGFSVCLENLDSDPVFEWTLETQNSNENSYATANLPETNEVYGPMRHIIADKIYQFHSKIFQEITGQITEEKKYELTLSSIKGLDKIASEKIEPLSASLNDFLLPDLINIIQDYNSIKLLRLFNALKLFDSWMFNNLERFNNMYMYNYHEENWHSLLQFLTDSKGGDFIYNFKEFTLLLELAKKNGYYSDKAVSQKEYVTQLCLPRYSFTLFQTRRENFPLGTRILKAIVSCRAYPNMKFSSAADFAHWALETKAVKNFNELTILTQEFANEGLDVKLCTKQEFKEQTSRLEYETALREMKSLTFYR